VWAHGGHPGATALARRFDFRRARELWQLGRDLTEPVAQPPLPDGVRLRGFVVGADEAEFLRVNNAAFDWHPEQGGWELEQVELREAEPWFDPDGFLLAVDETDRLLGYHWTKVHDTSPPLGEVYVLGVDPAERGRKLGAVLTAAGLSYLRDRGLGQVMLYVEADNTAAVRVYEALGFTRWGSDISYAR
jgi:mycothiol synthase